MAAVRFRTMRRSTSRAILQPAMQMVLEMGRSLEFMTTEKVPGSGTYTMVAAILMVCLLTFGVLHSFGVFR